MARSLLTSHVRDRSGNAIQNAAVFVYETGTTTAVGDLYLASSGGSPQSYLTSNNQGQVVGFVDTNRSVKLKTTDNNDTAYYPDAPTVTVSFDEFFEDPVPTQPLEVPPVTAFYQVGYSGTLTVSGGSAEIPVTFDGTLGDFTFRLGTAPTGATVILDVRKNGTTIFSSVPTIAIGTKLVTATPAVASATVTAGDYLEFFITQIGSTIAGADLTVAWSQEAA